MKKTRMIVAALMAMTMLLLCACGNSNKPANNKPAGDPAPAPQEQTNKPAEPAPETPAEPSAPAEFDGKLHGPFVMTTCGQSTGSVMFHMVAVQAGQTSVDEHQLMADELATVGADAKTLVITTGTSGKGMGAAGTDVNDEIERCVAVAQAAKDAGMTIVCAHVEGMSRRTDANDQASIDAILPLADVIVCVEDSDSDKLFSNYAADNNLPIIIVPDTLGLADYFA